MTCERFTVPVLVTLADDSEELRRITVEAWSLSEAIELAERRVREDERVMGSSGADQIDRTPHTPANEKDG